MNALNPYEEYYRGQVGGGLSVFSGPVIQRGRGFGNIFRSFFRFVRPVLQAILPVAKRAAPVIGKEMFKASTGVLEDMASGQEFGEAARGRFKKAGQHLGQAALSHLSQSGSGLKRKRSTKTRHSKKRRRTKRSKVDIFSG